MQTSGRFVVPAPPPPAGNTPAAVSSGGSQLVERENIEVVYRVIWGGRQLVFEGVEGLLDWSSEGAVEGFIASWGVHRREKGGRRWCLWLSADCVVDGKSASAVDRSEATRDALPKPQQLLLGLHHCRASLLLDDGGE
jgi:hypothetical protein